MVSNILRLRVYKPSLKLSVHVTDRKWASLLAIMVTFIVSEIIHEIMFYYLAHVKPMWEVIWFSVLHRVVEHWICHGYGFLAFLSTFSSITLMLQHIMNPAEEKQGIRIKVVMTKEEATLLQSKCKDGSSLEFKDLACLLKLKIS
ncbi:hypothetical protein FEM48_Zijuj11G0013800 [Ziziphus jujuba var. spinosa]|uniref:DUF7890 domain-containing protein n=1 Tax=Ziziphus jujuba var. spinosa TaxID=714518 RepID=A0A978UG12_ZIZJJ|nr:hypothetical protein FEM48_Zijuj11G0013800 [Ziziphus jujuba var. spinosa]